MGLLLSGWRLVVRPTFSPVGDGLGLGLRAQWFSGAEKASLVSTGTWVTGPVHGVRLARAAVEARLVLRADELQRLDLGLDAEGQALTLDVVWRRALR